ncbi:MAG: helix-turn-helix domain-containing protein [Gaiellaceae bacterium]
MKAAAANENERQEHVRVADAAVLLRAHPVTVRGWIREGLLPARRVGPRGHWRIPVSALKSEEES